MKTIKLLSLVITIITFANVLQAQDVNGIKIGTQMDKKTVIATFGTPDEYFSHNSEMGLSERYKYGVSELRFHEDGLFLGFTIKTNKFSVLTSEIPGGMKVGDSISVFKQIKCGMPKYNERLKMYSLFEERDCPMYIEVKDGVITALIYHDPV